MGAAVAAGAAFGAALGAVLGFVGNLFWLEGGVDFVSRLRGQVGDHFFALRQGQLGRLELVFTTWRSASRPWRRLRLLHRFFHRKYFFQTFGKLDVIQKQHEGQGRAPQSDDLAFQVCQPEAQVSQGDGAPNGHEVPIGADGARMSSPRLPSTLYAIMRTNSKTCCPPETKLGPSMWSMLKGLVGDAPGKVDYPTASGNCCCSSRSFRMRRLPS